MKFRWPWSRKKSAEPQSVKGASGEDAESGARTAQCDPPERRLHLGVDYGTSWSKLVFRDDAARPVARSVVVRPGKRDGGTGDYRLPSTVTLADGRLYFGEIAEDRGAAPGARAYRSLKVRMALPDHFHGVPTPLPDGFSEEDLATLYVLYLVQRGHAAGTRYANRLDSRVPCRSPWACP